ncbi:ATP-binding protein [Ammoniphilus sp. YIM 78166]|uniref:ATP-binding protein n=1 Tax=Ammoniphilus sp. YIM 78166 TaxID=1644106 RepID=UPI00106F61FF|nr:ATP-binding protein [Ammoniphilus sp. YIM 78166]
MVKKLWTVALIGIVMVSAILILYFYGVDMNVFDALRDAFIFIVFLYPLLTVLEFKNIRILTVGWCLYASALLSGILEEFNIPFLSLCFDALEKLGNVIGVILIFIGFMKLIKEKDQLTAFKREAVEQLMEEREQRYQLLFENTVDGIMIFDLDVKLLDGNPAIEQITGYTLEELRELGCLAITVPEEVDQKRSLIEKVLKQEAQEFESSIFHKDGRILTINCKIYPLIVGHEMVGLFEIVEDITEAKRMEEWVRQSDKLSMVGQLAAGVAHEIRNPLTTIKGFIQFLQSKIGTKYADIMLSELDRINFIVSEFLVLSKPQAVELKKVHIQSLIAQVIAFMEAQMNLKNIQVISHLPSDPLYVKSEENQLKQVFINLLKNAMESMAEGGTIEMELKPGVKMMAVQIRDEGRGMTEQEIKRLGEPFYSTKEGGTGLGLMVSRRIVENHGGQILFESQIHKGTSVYVMLPAAGDQERGSDSFMVN